MNLTKTGIKNSSLVLWLKFDLQGNVESDRTGNTNNAAFYNVSRINDGIYFNGSGALTVAPNPSICLTSTVSIVAFVNLASTTPVVTRIITKESGTSTDDFTLGVMQQGTVRFWVNSAPRVSGTNVIYGNLTDIIATYDAPNGNAVIYISGVVDAVNAGPLYSMVSSNNAITIGNNPSLLRGCMGTIKEVRVYNKSLTQAEVNEVHNELWNRVGTGLVSEWKFKEIGTVAIDTGGAGNHASIPNIDVRVSGGVKLTSTTIILNSSASLLSEISGKMTIYVKATIDSSPLLNTSALFTTENLQGIGGWGLWRNGAKNLRILHGTSSVIGASDLRSGTGSKKLCAVIQSGNGTLYINGVVEASGALTTAPVFTSADIRIGQVINGSGYYGPFTIHKIQIYNRALTQSEVAGLE